MRPVPPCLSMWPPGETVRPERLRRMITCRWVDLRGLSRSGQAWLPAAGKSSLCSTPHLPEARETIKKNLQSSLVQGKFRVHRGPFSHFLPKM